MGKALSVIIKSIDYFWVIASLLLAAATGYFAAHSIRSEIALKTQSVVIMELRQQSDTITTDTHNLIKENVTLMQENKKLSDRLKMCTGARERNNKRLVKFLVKNNKQQP